MDPATNQGHGAKSNGKSSSKSSLLSGDFGDCFEHYKVPYCGGALVSQSGKAKSGKGAGPLKGDGSRQHTVHTFPALAWEGRPDGSDVFFSSRWDPHSQIYDQYHTPKTFGMWWTTLPWQWVFIREVPFDIRADKMVWEAAPKILTNRKIKSKRYFQKCEFYKKYGWA